jgi:hypothetical protein
VQTESGSRNVAAARPGGATALSTYPQNGRELHPFLRYLSTAGVRDSAVPPPRAASGVPGTRTAPGMQYAREES